MMKWTEKQKLINYDINAHPERTVAGGVGPGKRWGLDIYRFYIDLILITVYFCLKESNVGHVIFF